VLPTLIIAITTNHGELIMNSNIVADYQAFIKGQIVLHEQLLECHRKGYSSLEILLTSNLNDYPASTLHGCLSGVSDSLKEAQALNESSLNVLLTRIKAEPLANTVE
jgi:hypothetical protein